MFSGRVLFLNYSDITETYYVFSGRVFFLGCMTLPKRTMCFHTTLCFYSVFLDYSDITETYYVFSGRVLFLGCMTLPKRTMLLLGMLFFEYNTITEACCVFFRTCAIPLPVTGH